MVKISLNYRYIANTVDYDEFFKTNQSINFFEENKLLSGVKPKEI